MEQNRYDNLSNGWETDECDAGGIALSFILVYMFEYIFDLIVRYS
ncbi:MAG: hypothetical protein Q4B52_03750 [Tissierellia bacterium]|nr:hypothetical protein [Tissierellia bacterium]